MYWRLALFFILLPLIEFLGICFIATNIFSWLIMLLVIIATGALGALLVGRQGRRCWANLNRQLDQGETPTVPLLHGVLVLTAALCLLSPGVITDFVGLLLLIPLLRTLIISHAILRFEAYRSRLAPSQFQSGQGYPRT